MIVMITIIMHNNCNNKINNNNNNNNGRGTDKTGEEEETKKEKTVKIALLSKLCKDREIEDQLIIFFVKAGLLNNYSG